MVESQGRRAAAMNAAIAQANTPAALPPVGPVGQGGINFGAAGAGVAASSPPVPNVIAVQPPGLPSLTPLEEALIGIGFSEEASRM
jgi:hypothetical protein